MRFTLAIVIFLVSVFLELVFIPRSFGVFLPLALWMAAVAMAMFEPRQVLGFSLAAGFLKTLFMPALGGFLLTLFIASALVVLLVRRFFGGAGFISDFAALAAAVVSFEILTPVLAAFYGLAGPANLVSSGVYLTATFPRELFLNVIFVLGAGLALYLYQRKRSITKSFYV